MVLKRKYEESIRISPSEFNKLLNNDDINSAQTSSASENDAKLSGYSDWSGEIDADGHRVNE